MLSFWSLECILKPCYSLQVGQLKVREMRFSQSNTLNTYILLKSKRNMTSDKSGSLTYFHFSNSWSVGKKKIYLFGVTKIVEGFIFDF